MHENLADVRVLRNILEKIAENTGFLVEAKLKDLLKSYKEPQETLITIHSIFNVKINLRNRDREYS